MTENINEKWYYKTTAIIVALGCVGPLALPLVWMNPKYSLVTKIVATLVVVWLTYITVKVFNDSLKSLNQFNQILQ